MTPPASALLFPGQGSHYVGMGKRLAEAFPQAAETFREADEVLGRVKVEKVYDELSAAAILPDSQEDNIREGDTVTAL